VPRGKVDPIPYPKNITFLKKKKKIKKTRKKQKKKEKS